MQAKPWRRGRAGLLSALLLLQVLFVLIPVPEVEGGGSPSGTFVDNGDGTWTVTYPVVMDTVLDLANPSSSMAAQPSLIIGHADGMESRQNALLGLDLDAVGFPTNATILNASLDLTRVSGFADLHVWTVLQEDWQHEEATWNVRRTGVAWSAAGAMGNADSGGLMDRHEVLASDVLITLDVSRATKIGQHRQLNSASPTAAVMLTAGPSVTDANLSLTSGETLSPALWSITVQWTSPSNLPNTPSWIDIQPKHGMVDADGSIDLSSTIRSQRGGVISAGITWGSDRGSIDSTGRFFPQQWAITTINMSGAGVEDEAEIWVQPGVPLSLAMAEENVQVTVDDVVQIIAHGLDQHGNPVTGLPIGWAASSGLIDAEGVYTPTELGTHTVAATWGNHVAVSNVTVDVGAAAVVILPQNFNARAGVGTQIPASVEDQMGNSLPLAAAAGLDWTVESGAIDSAGYFVGDDIGTFQINVTSGVGASGSGFVTVGPGLIDHLEIIHPSRTILADEVVPLDLRWHDRVGNNVSVLITLDNWSAENGNFIVGDGVVEWLPSQAGIWWVSVHADGVEDTIEVTVVTGEIDQIWIDADHQVFTADDETGLILQAEDNRGNRWPISANWSVAEPEAAPWLIMDEDGVRFVGTSVGSWTIMATHDRPEGALSTYLTLEVRAGRLARIGLPSDGSTLSADDVVNLTPSMTDADGNAIEGILLNWTLDGEDITQEIRMANSIWQPTTTGDHLIEASAAGRTDRSRINIIQGLPHTLHLTTDLSQQGVTRSGAPFNITAYAVDLDGNQAPWVVEWTLPDSSIEIEETAWVGVYEARGLGEGIWTIEAQSGSAWGSMDLQVLFGDARALRISEHSGEGSQGGTLSLTVHLVDHGGNSLPMQSTKVQFDTEIGTISHDGGPHWTLHLDEPGTSQSVVIQYEEWQAETFIDVEATGIDRLTGSVGGRMLLGGFLVAALLIFLLFRIVSGNTAVQPHWEDEFEVQAEVSGVTEPAFVPMATAGSAQESSRTLRRRHAHQRQKERTIAMRAATTEMSAEVTIPAIQEPAQQAVLTAMRGTVQGQSGWYQTGEGESQNWRVEADGSWMRVG
jgi:hypothetical protein